MCEKDIDALTWQRDFGHVNDKSSDLFATLTGSDGTFLYLCPVSYQFLFYMENLQETPDLKKIME